MSAGLQQRQHTSLGAMSQVMMDLLYSLTNCMFCFPGSPQLKINNRSFKMQHLLGEVSPQSQACDYWFVRTSLTMRMLGRLLIRLPSSRHIYISTLRSEKDPLSLWPRICFPRPQRSGSLHTLLATPQYHTLHRPFGSVCKGQIGSGQ